MIIKDSVIFGYPSVVDKLGLYSSIHYSDYYLTRVLSILIMEKLGVNA